MIRRAELIGPLELETPFYCEWLCPPDGEPRASWERTTVRPTTLERALDDLFSELESGRVARIVEAELWPAIEPGRQ